MRKRFNSFEKRLIIALIAGFFIGAAWLVALRLFTYENPNTHYHANFALYVNGERDLFDSFTFYEEVQTCGSDEVNNPRTRVHLHDNVNHVAHVHDPASTWGHLFANLGYTLGDGVLMTDKGVFVDGADGKKLTFILNGEEVDGVANRTIRSEDALLINFGNEAAGVLQERFDGITRDAADYNQRNDPSSCTGTKPVSFWNRLQSSIGLD